MASLYMAAAMENIYNLALIDAFVDAHTSQEGLRALLRPTENTSTTPSRPSTSASKKKGIQKKKKNNARR